MTKVQFEHTDLFGGQANYSWVKRESFSFEDNPNDISLVRRAKKWAGISGVRARVGHIGDMIAIYPYGYCQVIFITSEY